MTRYILTLAIITISYIASKAATKEYDAATEAWLARLDSVVVNAEHYEHDRQEYISNLIRQRDKLHDAQDIYRTNCEIYELASIFDSDLAMEIVDANEAIASKMGDRNKVSEWQINRSFVLAVTGMLMEADAVMDRIDTSGMPRWLRVQYYGQMIYLNSHFEQYIGKGVHNNSYEHLVTHYRDSLRAIIQPGDRDYTWHKACMDIDNGRIDSTRVALEKLLSKSDLTTREDAANAYALALIYKMSNDNEHYVQALAMSSIADVQLANKDIASLEELAGVIYTQQVCGETADWLSDGNDKFISRAYNYINICLRATQKFHNRVRVISIARVLDNIYKAFLNRDTQQRASLQRSLIIAVALILLTVVAVVLVVLMYRKAKMANLRLATTNEQMAIKNIELEESNFVKEEYIGYVFSICSNYISKLDEYRKTVNRKLMVKQIDELLTMTSKSMVQEELQDFFKDFDAIFLHIYPDFVTEFNELLQPEERIEPKKGELLNTNLRIYALVRLGISDSVKIAELLHCSSQTVYNNRLKIRNKAIVPKEQFVDYVMKIGRKKM